MNCQDCKHAHDRRAHAQERKQLWRDEWPTFECRRRAPVAGVDSDGNEIVPFPMPDPPWCGDGDGKTDAIIPQCECTYREPGAMPHPSCPQCQGTGEVSRNDHNLRAWYRQLVAGKMPVDRPLATWTGDERIEAASLARGCGQDALHAFEWFATSNWRKAQGGAP